MQPGKLDRRVQFQRATGTHDGLSTVKNWANLGSAVWAQRTLLSDGERWRAQAVQATATARFTVRWSTFAAGITTKDRIVCEGKTFDITGIKEVGRRAYLEMTAAQVEP